MLKKFLTVCALSLTCVTGTSVQAQDTVLVEDTWGLTGFRWQGGGEMLLRFAFFEKDGLTEVCMAYASRGGITAKANRAALKEAKVIMNDETILRSLTRAKSHSSRAIPTELVGSEANCVMTKAPWPTDGFRGGVDWRFGTYKLE